MTRQIFTGIWGSNVKGHKLVNLLTDFQSNMQIMYQILMCAMCKNAKNLPIIY